MPNKTKSGSTSKKYKRVAFSLRVAENTPCGVVLRYCSESKQQTAASLVTEAVTMAYLPFAYAHAGLDREEVTKLAEATIWQLQAHIHKIRCAYLPETLDIVSVPLSKVTTSGETGLHSEIIKNFALPGGVEPATLESTNQADSIAGEKSDYENCAELLGVTAEDREVLETLCPFD